MKRIICLNLLLVFYLTSIGQLKNYNANGKVKILSEKSYLKITENKVAVKNQQQSFAAVAGALLPPVIDVISTTVKNAAKRRALSFKGEYKASASESGFYEDDDNVNLPNLTLTRQILIKGQSSSVAAATIELTAELSDDKTAFRYKLKSVTYSYSIARTKAEYDYIEVGLEIKFKTVALNKGQYEVKDLRGTTLTIPMVQVGTTYSVDGSSPIYSGWIPFPPKPSVEMEVRKIDKESKSVVTEGTKDDKPTPKETSKQETTTTKVVKDIIILNKQASVYEIEITVVETNPYKIKAENKQQLVEETSESGTGLLKAIVEQVFKKEEEEKKKEEEEQ